jgi:hypothetical protein
LCRVIKFPVPPASLVIEYGHSHSSRKILVSCFEIEAGTPS